MKTKGGIIELLWLWFDIKICLSQRSRRAIFKEREIWWCSVGQNVGEEIFGKSKVFSRPVLVFKKLTANSFLGLPLTSQEKVGTWYVPIRQSGQVSQVMLNQARNFDILRLWNRIGTIDDKEFMEVKKAFKSLYCP